LPNLDWGDYRLAIYNLETDEVVAVPDFPEGKNINPQWAADGSSLYFLSDQSGITNVYRVSVADRQIYQITNLTTGVSGITALSPAMSVSTESNKMVFSAFEGDRYTLYAIDDESVLEGGPVEAPLGEISPAVLPPADRPVGDVMALVDNAYLGLPPTSDEFEDTKYRAGLSLDYIAPPTVAVGADRFGTFVGGGTALFWSDILGVHNVVTALQVNGGFSDIAALAGYQNRKSRWNWSLIGAQTPISTIGYFFTDEGDNVIAENIVRLRQIAREVSVALAYPLNRVQRVEFSARYQNIIYDYENDKTFIFGNQIIDTEKIDLPKCSVDPTEPFCEPNAMNIGAGTAALVYDNTFFGYTGPVLGQRYRLEVAPVIGTIDYVGALVDFRKYIQPVAPYTFATRIMHFGRYGDGGEDFRLYPLFIGYQQLIRGYENTSFSGSECVDGIDDDSFVGQSNCPVYNQLFGSRMFLANFELRTPFPQGFGVNAPNFLPITLAVFFDAGVAWWTQDTALQVGGNKDPWNLITSYGVAARINLFGLMLMEIDFVHPNNRPQKGWIWQFGFSPGF
jgi:hypothetical protein